jgi:hypothetical protein
MAHFQDCEFNQLARIEPVGFFHWEGAAMVKKGTVANRRGFELRRVSRFEYQPVGQDSAQLVRIQPGWSGFSQLVS